MLDNPEVDECFYCERKIDHPPEHAGLDRTITRNYAFARWYYYEAIFYARQGMIPMAEWKMVNAQFISGNLS